MSRIGKRPIEVPSGVNVSLSPGRVMVNGPLGELSQQIPTRMQIDQAEGTTHKTLVIELKYARGRERVLTDLKRVSKPGRRIYARKDRLPRVLGGMGVAILSTSSGVMTSRTAEQQGVGGEVICFVW